jgi:hypothetical protein
MGTTTAAAEAVVLPAEDEGTACGTVVAPAASFNHHLAFLFVIRSQLCLAAPTWVVPARLDGRGTVCVRRRRRRQLRTRWAR